MSWFFGRDTDINGRTWRKRPSHVLITRAFRSGCRSNNEIVQTVPARAVYRSATEVFYGTRNKAKRTCADRLSTPVSLGSQASKTDAHVSRVANGKNTIHVAASFSHVSLQASSAAAVSSGPGRPPVGSGMLGAAYF